MALQPAFLQILSAPEIVGRTKRISSGDQNDHGERFTVFYSFHNLNVAETVMRLVALQLICNVCTYLIRSTTSRIAVDLGVTFGMCGTISPLLDLHLTVAYLRLHIAAASSHRVGVLNVRSSTGFFLEPVVVWQWENYFPDRWPENIDRHCAAIKRLFSRRKMTTGTWKRIEEQ